MKKQQSFKYFISKLYLISVALILAFVFYIIYHSVKYYIYDGIDNDLVKEWNVHKNEIEYKDNQLKIIHLKEWEEREHQSLEVNPVFVAFYNINGKLIEKSPNLKGFNLVLNKNLLEIRIENHKASIYNIRQIQKPIYYENKKIGYLCVALAIDNINILLDKLTLILILLLPFSLILLYIVVIIIADYTTEPINEMVHFVQNVSKKNLSKRISLKQNKTELYLISNKINSFLDQIEKTIEREKQFTSEISHELRTPIAIIKGKLEVLIRKERPVDEYEKKIKEILSEINQLNLLIEQLLILARYESLFDKSEIEKINIFDCIFTISQNLATKRIKIINNPEIFIFSNPTLIKIMIQNLILNALNYSEKNIEIYISDATPLVIKIKDFGDGISEEELKSIFEPFFRINNNSMNTGFGLGLNIVEKISTFLKIRIEVESTLNVGTTFTIYF